MTIAVGDACRRAVEQPPNRIVSIGVPFRTPLVADVVDRQRPAGARPRAERCRRGRDRRRARPCGRRAGSTPAIQPRLVGNGMAPRRSNPAGRLAFAGAPIAITSISGSCCAIARVKLPDVATDASRRGGECATVDSHAQAAGRSQDIHVQAAYRRRRAPRRSRGPAPRRRR